MFTLIIPSLLLDSDIPLPALATPAFNQLRRFAQFTAHSLSTTQLYQQFLCDQLTLPPCSAYASPVVQQMGMNSVQMLDAQAACTPLSPEEAEQLIAQLNQLYAGEYTWQMHRTDLWQLTANQPLTWQADSIWQACGTLAQTVQAAPDWLQLSTELQMWLHNQNTPINALWLWNAPAAQTFERCQLLGTDSAWQQQSSLHIEAAPHDWDAWQRACEEHHIATENTHLFLDDLASVAQTGDLAHYQQQILAYEQRFFAPIWQALCTGRLKNWRLICEHGQWQLHGKPARWAFWRKNQPFTGNIA